MSSPRVLFFLGAPASGKGSYTKLAVEAFRCLTKTQALKVPQIHKIVASDLIKEELKRGSAIGKRMAPFMEKHQHVPSELMADLLKTGIRCKGAGLVLVDGFPRNVEQARIFLEDHDALSCLHLDVPRFLGRAKAVGRLNCPHCDFPYNDASVDEGGFFLEADMPDKPKCGKTRNSDVCGYPNALIRRDSGEVFDQRFELYLKEEKPVVEFLKQEKAGKVQEIIVRGGYHVMSDDVMKGVVEGFGIQDEIAVEDVQRAAKNVLKGWGG